MQAAMDAQAATAIIADAVASVSAPVESQMEVDGQVERGVKRAAEEEVTHDAQKKTKIGECSSVLCSALLKLGCAEPPQAPLKRYLGMLRCRDSI